MTTDPQGLHRSIFEGDNLHVLRGMNSASVELIYLDPPFNSKTNYSTPIGSEAAGAAFKDTWTLSDIDLLDHNRLKLENRTLYALIYAAGRSHSKGMFSYLMMMAPRTPRVRAGAEAFGLELPRARTGHVGRSAPLGLGAARVKANEDNLVGRRNRLGVRACACTSGGGRSRSVCTVSAHFGAGVVAPVVVA